MNRPFARIRFFRAGVQRTPLRAPLVGRGLVSRRFGSMKSVCNGGTKAPPYNAPLTHLRWELPPRGAFRKKLPRKENAIIHNRLRVTLSRAGMFANAGRGRRPRRPENDVFLLRIGVLMRLNILPVGTGVLDGPKTKEF